QLLQASRGLTLERPGRDEPLPAAGRLVLEPLHLRGDGCHCAALALETLGLGRHPALPPPVVHLPPWGASRTCRRGGAGMAAAVAAAPPRRRPLPHPPSGSGKMSPKIARQRQAASSVSPRSSASTARQAASAALVKSCDAACRSRSG